MTDLSRIENLTDKQINILNGEVERNKKSTGAAYLLLLFLGMLGAHKFYLGKPVWGVVYLALSIFGWATLAIAIGFLPLVVLGILLIIDLFTIPGQIRKHTEQIKNDIIEKFERQNTMKSENEI